MKIKKSLVSLVIAGALSVGASCAVFAEGTQINITLNGVNMENSSIQLNNGRIYMSVEKFAQYYGVKYSLDATNKLILNGKNVTSGYGDPTLINGILVDSVRAMAEALGEANDKKEGHFAVGWEQEKQTANVTILPKGVVPLEGHFIVPKMGEHWADVSKLPLGPVWGIYKGKLVFFEYMPDKELNKDVTLDGTAGVPIPPFVNHTDINWNPQGHPGDEAPHYDVHLYFISKEEQNMIK